ncbi:T6SS immunity protein Tli4 family protein [Cupriavidus taiwanensis]|uniref:Tle cognate immunity protein 4 C-terminal domain-containing protein n=1 Tax=Cupriavidus taiwanensis TaxID=164546 RepID=A0A375J7A5_9BURK|nr:T6SS immunity protein Tli4 family protein [Cupriavidus taiwanensis]SPR99843.1 conserved exported hypothetical protein [Cupriavidus taiwanensis]
MTIFEAKFARRLVFAVCSAGLGFGASAQEVPSSWRTECVGRTLLKLPGEVEVAALSAADFREYAAGNGDAYPRSKFPDGQYAFGPMQSFMGLLMVSQPEEESRRREFRQAAERRKVADLTRLKANHGITPRGQRANLETLATARHAGVAWRMGSNYSTYIEVGRSALWWGVSGRPEEKAVLEKYYLTLINGVQPRPLFTVPSVPGVCLPHVFISDDATNPRSISVAYRLREHPDVTVWMEDRNARVVDKIGNPSAYSAAARADFFWMQDYAGNYQSVRSLWQELYKDVTVPAGRGVESFVALKRKDGTEDYGYLLSLRGEPNAKEDRPDLMMYVIRDAAYARAKGLDPISREGVLELGKTIAASMRALPVK